MNNEIVKKAYKIDLEKIDEGYLFGDFICYADTRNEAKSSLLKEVEYESMIIKNTGEELTYLNIPIVRCKSADLLDFEGSEKKLWEINEILAERKRIKALQEILNNEHIKYCYIRKGGYYRPNFGGYTESIYKAGVYTKEDAVSHAKSCRDIWLERIDIEEHNQIIKSKIIDLESRILA
ncbi:hypothetical protein [Flammeovirga sp. SJP92]|uniref:hypothetical protein n=1 Tax=Flammeovirga sp. SJP92 TaxID=1775430 RepID=UPI00078848F6|nr:hypothetical protein [Flammeovirga sp. SJP92]KXX72754.1 hypothetical protein AVL50_32150 [Flammeovirga sp. SJP92]